MKNLLILFLLLPMLATAQEFKDTLFLQKQGTDIFLYQYREYADGRQEGLISGAFRVKIDSATAANYVAEQRIQVTNDLWSRETSRINTGTYTRKLTELDTISRREFGVVAGIITRDAAKPELLSYRVNAPADTTFLWQWRFFKTGSPTVDAQIVERFSTKVLRIIINGGSELVLTADSEKVFRFTFDGATRFFYRNPDNNNEWLSFGPAKETLYRLVRRPNTRISTRTR